MDSIFKRDLLQIPEQQISMAKHARILCVQLQDSAPHIWYTHHNNEPLEPRTIYMRGTGQQCTGFEGSYIGTVQMPNGLVWHYFDSIKL